jgi:hypothetical protein
MGSKVPEIYGESYDSAQAKTRGASMKTEEKLN